MRRTLMPAPMGLILIAFAGLIASPGGETRAQGVTNIEVGNYYFCSPASQDNICETSISAGDTVVWNVASGIHTVTECANSYSTCPPSGGFDSGQLSMGGSFSHTFDTVGVFEYHCDFHPDQMRGSITVTAQVATATPTPTAAQTPAPTATLTATQTLAPTASPVAAPVSGGLPDRGAGAGEVTALAVVGGLFLITLGFLVRKARRL